MTVPQCAEVEIDLNQSRFSGSAAGLALLAYARVTPDAWRLDCNDVRRRQETRIGSFP
jgi:hypothetical protein